MEYLYLYDPDTHEFTGKSIKQLDKVASERIGKQVYFSVPNSTDIEPPKLNTPGVAFCFSEERNEWLPVEDNRSRLTINTETKEVGLYPVLGKIQPPYITDIPSDFSIDFVTYNGSEWVLTDRADILDRVWELRKRIREMKCKAPIEYNGHLFKCNKASINDLLSALEEIRLDNDPSTTIQWITNDGAIAPISESDIQHILKLYRQRREILVNQSINNWKEDELRSDSDLLRIFEELSNLV